MLINFLKVIVRHLARSRFFAILNICGLSIGMASCIVIYLYVTNELSYDKFHVGGEKIYRVIRQSRINSMPYNIGVTSAPYAEALKQDYGDRIQSVTRTLAMSSLIKFEDKSFIEEKLLLGDRNFFEFFSFPLAKGSAASVLGNANNIVVSRSFARKYFGDADPIGKVLRMDDLYDLQVSGVLDEIPGNTHLQFDAVGSIALANGEPWMNDWWANSFNTYVRVETPQDADYLSKTFPHFMDKYFGRDFERVGNRIGLKLEPLHDIYFNYDTRYEDNIKHGDKSYVFVFGSIGILLIILAAINYINLATAQTAERAKEVGIRKTLGSGKGSIAVQFLSESALLCLMSLVVALALAQVAISFFKSSFGIAIPGLLSDPFLWIFLLLLLTIISISSGAYPSFLLASFKPVSVLKGNAINSFQYLFVRKALVVFQFGISAFMIISTLFIGEQLEYMREKDLGFNSDQLVLVRLNNDNISKRGRDFRTTLLSLKGFENASFTSGHPGGFYDATTISVQGSEDRLRMRTLTTDENLLNTMGLTVAEGRFFSEEFPADSISSVILNETAVRQLGWENPDAIGRRVMMAQFDTTYRTIIGIVKDYHFTSLKEKIEPLIMSYDSRRGNLLVRISGTDMRGTIANLEKTWSSFNTAYPLEFSFVDDVIDKLYSNEKVQGKIFTVFSTLSVIIACLGILGLASYIASQRRKEIGVRKVLGASAKQLSFLLMQDLLALVLVANVLAIPLGYWAIDRWSSGFAYRVNLHPVIFIIGGLGVFLLAMLIVGINASKVAMQNPVKALRSE